MPKPSLQEQIALAIYSNKAKRPEKWDKESQATRDVFLADAEAVLTMLEMGHTILSNSEYAKLVKAAKPTKRPSIVKEEEAPVEEVAE